MENDCEREPQVDAQARRILALEAEVRRLQEVAGWAQATLTALNVGDVAAGSPLHLKLREVMIAYREATEAAGG